MTDTTPAESLIQFPTAFPIKIMGKNHPDFAQTMVELVRPFDPTFDPAQVAMRPSKGGNYIGLTLTITATSRAQLDDIYRAISAHPMVAMAL